jgi:hypothetical protein
MKRAIPIFLFSACAAWAQAPMRLTLDEAEAIAIKNHPQVSAAASTPRPPTRSPGALEPLPDFARQRHRSGRTE